MDCNVFRFPCYLLFDFLAVSMVVIIGVATMWLRFVTQGFIQASFWGGGIPPKSLNFPP